MDWVDGRGRVNWVGRSRQGGWVGGRGCGLGLWEGQRRLVIASVAEGFE